MIEVLLLSGIWVEVYEDKNLTTEELSDVANDSGLQVNTAQTALLPNMTTVDCTKIAAIRINH